MARTTRLGSIEIKIKKKQEKLFELKDRCDAITTELQKLLKERDEIRKEELLKELDSSGRTYEEIIEYLRSAPKRNTDQPATKRRYRRGRPRKTD